MKKVIIFGDTSFSGIIAEYINASAKAKVVAFTVDDSYINQRKLFENLPLISFEEIEKHYSPKDYYFLCAVSAASKKIHLNMLKFNESKMKGYKMFSFVHPSAFVAPSAEVGENVIIFPHAVIEPRAKIGNGVFVRSSAYVSHETEIGAFSYLAPRCAFSGKVKTGEHCFFGTNSTIRDGVQIGGDVIVGAGAVVLKDLPNQTVLKAAESKILPVNRFNIKL